MNLITAQQLFHFCALILCGWSSAIVYVVKRIMHSPSLFAQTLYIIVIGLALPILLLLAWMTFKRRYAPGAKAFFVLLLLAIETISMYLILALTESADVGLIVARLRFIGLAISPVYYFLFAIEFTSPDIHSTRPIHASLLLIPFITQFTVWDVLGQGLFFKDWTFIQHELIADDDPNFTGWFWLHTVYANGLFFLGTLLLVRFAIGFGHSHRHSLILISGGMVVMMVLGTLRNFVDTAVNPTPFSILGLALLIAWILFRQKIFDVLPVACEHIFQGMHDGVIVLNNLNIIVHVNRAAERILNIERDALIQKNIKDIPIFQGWIDDIESGFEATWSEVAPVRTYEINKGQLDNNRGIKVGQFILLRDITEAKRALQAEMKQRQFTEALLDITAAVGSTLKLTEVIDRMFSALSNVVNYDWANMMLIEDQVAYIIACRGYSETVTLKMQRAQFSLENTPTLQQMAESCEPIIVDDTLAFADWQHSILDLNIRSYAGAPIVRGTQVIGFINLDSNQPDAFTARDAERLKAFASQMAVAVLNARLYEQVQEDAAVAERQRLARDLHDAVSQTLFSASVTAETLPHLIDRDLDMVRHGLDQLVKLTRGALSEMRILLVELRPSALANTDLNILLTHLVNSLKTRTTAEVTYTIDGSPRSIAHTDVKIGLYRIIQEALNNVVKHSNAHHVNMVLGYNQTGVWIRVEDDGVGFNEVLLSPTHLGIRIMRERAAVLNIDLTIQSMPNQGTVIDARWEGETL